MSLSRTVPRLLASLALALLVLPVINARASITSRDFSLCVRACNEFRRECNAQDVVACVAGQDSINIARMVDCALMVSDRCTVESRQCKVTCVPTQDEP